MLKSKVISIFLFIVLLMEVSAKTPYVILISFDGFRWDYLDRNLTPNMQNMINNGVKSISFRPAFPSKTFPNHYSIITGMYPEHHGIISNSFKNFLTGEDYRINDPNEKLNSKWYLGEAFWETAQKNNIIAASYFWPGSTINDKARRPTYFKYYDETKPYKERLDTLFQWLQLPCNTRPHFLTVYFSETDDIGHRYGPNSIEINKAISECDSLIGYLNNGLEKIGMKDSVNVIIVSDHGMTEISKEKIINVEKFISLSEADCIGNGPFMLIEPKRNIDRQKIYNALRENEFHFKVYFKENIPEYYHYSESELIPQIILIADKGWSLELSKGIENWNNDLTRGNHGYDNNLMDMHGIFLAAGPLFKKNYKIGTIWNIDIYPLLCKIFNIPINPKIDGKLERIGFILN